MLAKQRAEQRASFPIVGAGCRFPGGVADLGGLWRAFVSGEVFTGCYPEGPPGVNPAHRRWNPAAYGGSPALTAGGFLSNLGCTDNPAGVSEEEFVHMDPQHRLLLVCLVDALRSANLPVDVLRGQKVGVFIGISTSEYMHAAIHCKLSPDQLSPYMGIGCALSAAPARLAMHLGCQGPALAVDSACSSALAALHQAKLALRSGECDWAVVGASHLLLNPYTSLVFAKAGMLSPTGVARIFDSAADGHVRGEGAGLILLTRRELLEKFRLTPLAWLKGTSLHQLGARQSMSVSSGVSQQTVLESALRDADVSPAQVRYVEVHATGSPLATVVEVDALRRTYGSEAELTIGSGKANFGHLETASGMLGLLRLICILAHRLVPAQANLNRLDDQLAAALGKISVARDHCNLAATPGLFGGISCFGFTGSNAHAIVEAGDAEAVTSATSSAVNSACYWAENNYWE